MGGRDDAFVQEDDLTDVNDGEPVEEEDYPPAAPFRDPAGVDAPPDLENQNVEEGTDENSA